MGTVTAKSDSSALFGVRDAARALNISEPYVRYLTDTGRLACIRDRSGRRRFSRADIRAFRKKRRRRVHVNRARQAIS